MSVAAVGTSQAAMRKSAGVGTWSAGQSKSMEAKIGGTTGIFASKVLGAPLKISSSALSSEEGKVVQSGSSSAMLAGKLVFEGLAVLEPAGCKTTATIQTVALRQSRKWETRKPRETAST